MNFLRDTFEDKLERSKKSVYSMSNKERYLNDRCNSLAPLTLNTLKGMSNDDLIQVILLREISYNELLQQMNLNRTFKRVNECIDGNHLDGESWFSKKLRESNLIIARLENKIALLESSNKEVRK